MRQREGPLYALVEAALVFAIETLARRPELSAKLREAMGMGAPVNIHAAIPFMSVAEYARHRRVSERTVRYMIKDMTEGLHYHRDGLRGRRVILHVNEADKWRAEHERGATGVRSIEELAVDEVTRRRARAALKQVKGT